MLRSDWRLVGAASDLQTRHAQTTAIIKQSSVCFGGLIKWTITSLRAREVIRRSFLYLFFFFFITENNKLQCCSFFPKLQWAAVWGNYWAFLWIWNKTAIQHRNQQLNIVQLKQPWPFRVRPWDLWVSCSVWHWDVCLWLLGGTPDQTRSSSVSGEFVVLLFLSSCCDVSGWGFQLNITCQWF